jgi:FlaA1/EpsC-like NDP-sugar epimerase
MTIPEAVQLIIRAGSLASDRAAGQTEVYVLDMGEPVAIEDLARQMIELSGLDPDRDIEIEEIGPRPGEKLDEQLFNVYERPQPTAAEKILLAEREPLSREEVEAMFAEINLLVLEGDAAALAAKVAELSAVRHRSGMDVSTATVSGPQGRARTVVEVDPPRVKP